MPRLAPGIFAVGTLMIAVPAHAQIDWTVQAEDIPKQRPWMDPASFGFKSIGGGEDYFDIAAAVSASRHFGDFRGFASAAVVRRSNPGKEIESYAAKIGAKFEWSSDLLTGDPRRDVTVYLDPALVYARATTFRDLKAVCTTLPRLATCDDQYQGSVRAELKMQYFTPIFSEAPYRPGPNAEWESGRSFVWEFTPVTTLFHDRVVEATTDATRLKLEGSATGFQTDLAGAVIPRWGDYRVVFRSSVKQMVALDRSGPRAEAFPANAMLFTASATYEWGVRSFEGRKGWTPSVGITYSSGDDPLTARQDSEETTLLFKIALTQ